MAEQQLPDTQPHSPENLSELREQAWKLAASSRRAEAYFQLIELDRASPDTADLALRLYWLLAIQPELDAKRTRHVWLLAALTRSRLTGPATELYKRELDADPRVGLSKTYARLLEVEAAGEHLLRLAYRRLSAAGSNRAWAAMTRDLETLATRTSSFDEVSWLTYLVAVMTHASFDRPEPLYQRCGDLLATLRHLEIQESWAFEQIEKNQRLATAWRAAAGTPPPLLELVRDDWISPVDGWKNSLWRATAWAAADPVDALFQFEQAARIPERQLVLAEFQRIVSRQAPPREDNFPPELIRGLIREFLQSNGRGHYDAMRPALLRFLVREAIDPQEMVQACLLDSSLGPRALVEHVRTDPMLRLVWRTAHAQG